MTSTCLRIALATQDLAAREILRATLVQLGHQVEIVTTHPAVGELCRDCGVHLLIADHAVACDGVAGMARLVGEAHPVPMVAVLEADQVDALDRAASPYVFGFLVKPIKVAAIRPVIEVADRRFRELQTLRQETESLRQAICDRKVIERAKGIVMRHGNVDEPEAFRRLQKLARNKSKKLVAVAQMIITAEEASLPPQPPKWSGTVLDRFAW